MPQGRHAAPRPTPGPRRRRAAGVVLAGLAVAAGALEVPGSLNHGGALTGVASAGVFGRGSVSRVQPATPLSPRPVSPRPAPRPVLAADDVDARAAAVRVSRSLARTRLREEQQAARRRFLDRTVLPLRRYRELSAGFGDVSWLWSRAHTGQDFVVRVGTPVHAVRRGVVTHAGWAGAYGYRVAIRHADGLVTFYCHLSRLQVRKGPVAAGQVIGRSGNTGNSTGAHLHFEVRPDGRHPVDPMRWLRARGLRP